MADSTYTHANSYTHTHAHSRLLKAMGNEQRLKILMALLDGETSVSDLSTQLSLGQSALSQHLACLRNEGLVSMTRRAQCHLYRIQDPRVPAIINIVTAQPVKENG